MKAAILGSPIVQALSPILHRAAYRALGLDWSYEAIDCPSQRLPAFLAGIDRTEWAGFSLTMPLKRAVIPLLDDATPLVTATGAANTITIQDGRLLGDNTDIHGMLAALARVGLHRPGTATILGAGATAATAFAALYTLGCTDITVVARDLTRAAHLQEVAARLHTAIALTPWRSAKHHLSADVVISALPPKAADDLAPSWPESGNVLLDVVYQPAVTPLLQAAGASGTTTVNGAPMLIHQAARQIELQTGLRPAPLTLLEQTLQQQLT